MSAAALGLAGVSLVAGLFGVLWRSEGHAPSFEWELRTLAILLGLPGYAAFHLFGGDYFTVKGQLGAFAVNAVAWWSLLSWRRRLRAGGAERTGRAEGLSRRQFLHGGAAMGVAAVAVGYGYRVENRSLEVVRLPWAMPGLPSELKGLRVAVVADLHCGPLNPNEYLGTVVQRINSLQPDLVLIPGDFVDKHGRYFDDAARFVTALRPRIGVVGTLGNHDHWEGTDLARRKLLGAGMHLVDNDRLFLTADRRLVASPPSRGLALPGVGDLWVDEPDLDRAMRDVPAGMPRLLLSHNPDFAEECSAGGHRVDLMVSGHTHGGQIRVPVLGTPFLPSRYGQKYASGLVQGPRWPVYVTRGVGVAGAPVRLGVRPEVTLLELA